MGRVWLSDGQQSGGATLYYRAELVESETTALAETNTDMGEIR